MSDVTQGDAEPFRIDISADALTATLTVAAGAPVAPSLVIGKLRELGIKRFDEKGLSDRISAAGGKALDFAAAIGVAPIDERPEGPALLAPLSEGQLTKVAAGAGVAKIEPRVTGKAGQDVFGAPIPFRKRSDKIKAGRNLSVKDGKVIATIGGSLRLHGETLSVEALHEIDGADDAASASLEYEGDVAAQNCFREGRSLRTTGSMWVADAVEAVQLNIGDGLHVSGGIVGKEKGHCTVGGDVTCKFISGGQITAGRDIRVEADVAVSRVACLGQLMLVNGRIYGGEVSANGGIRCHTLGNANGTPTVIEAGADTAFCALLLGKSAEIDANRKHVQQVRQKLEPLLKQQKLLSRQQRERATELLYEADELEARTIKEITELGDRYRAISAMARAEVAVADTVFAGVIIRFPGVEATIATSLKGPFTIALRGQGQASQIVMISGAEGCEHTLESHVVPDPCVPIVERFFGKSPSAHSARSQCIKAFVTATRELFQTMVRMPLTLAKARIKDPGERIFKLYKISATIHLTGSARGCVWISFSERVAIALGSALSGEAFKSLDRDCRDALSEIANMIVGAAKRDMATQPVVVSVPILESTEDLDYLPTVPTIVLPFDTAAGRFIIEVAMVEASCAQSQAHAIAA